MMIKYKEERLNETLNNKLCVNALFDTHKKTYTNLIANKTHFHILDWTARFVGLCYCNDIFTDNFNLIIPIENRKEITNVNVLKAINCFDFNVWKKTLRDIVISFDVNQSKKTVDVLNAFDSLVRYGALLLYAETNNLNIENIQDKWYSLRECQNILLKNVKTDYTDNLNGVYNCISVFIQSIAFMFNEKKADDRIVGFYGELLSVLYHNQLENDVYKINCIRQKFIQLYNTDLTGEPHEIRKSETFPIIQKAVSDLKSVELDYQQFFHWIKRIELKELIFCNAEKLFSDKYNYIYVVLSPSRYNLFLLNENEYNKYCLLYPDKFLLSKLKTVNADNINKLSELKEVVLKWIKEIVSKLALISYELKV